jgi:hypothetical protein
MENLKNELFIKKIKIINERGNLKSQIKKWKGASRSK